jgi:hypothetical protein
MAVEMETPGKPALFLNTLDPGKEKTPLIVDT